MKRLNFRSDNEAPVAGEIMRALAEVNTGPAHSYGEDEVTGLLTKEFSEVFETRVAVFPMATGTAANALAIAQMCPPYGAAFCHRHAHLYTDECGAPEFFSGGAKLLPLDGPHGRIQRDEFAETLAACGELGDHESLPAALSISQATEMGTVYTPADVTDLAGLAHEHDLRLHMDGARFANAVHYLGCTPAEITWRAGVDILSFGATKNGAMLAEALIVFDENLALQLGRRRKRAGQLLSKQRYVSAQLRAYLRDGLWLKLAGRANRSAQELARGLEKIDGIRLPFTTQANEVFARLPADLAEAMARAGLEFHHWPGTRDLYRFVTSFATESDDVESFVSVTERLARGCTDTGDGTPDDR